MSSNPRATKIASSYAIGSPLDQIVNGSSSSSSSSSRHTLLDRAVTLTRKATVQSRPQRSPSQDSEQGGQETSYYTPTDTDGSTATRNGYSYALGGPERAQAAASGSNRQPVLGMHYQKQSPRIHSSPSASYSETIPGPRNLANSSLLSNAFRDSVASDVSFNSISGREERYSMVGSPPMLQGELQQDSDRIAQALQGLALRRRQSIDTVRSSEFGEGGKWDRAWGGSDDEEDDEEGYGVNHGQSLADLDIEGKNGKGWAALDHLGNGRWQSRDESKRATLTASPMVTNSNQFPALHDASGVEHVVSLTPSRKNTAQMLNPRRSDQQDDHLHRRDTMRSVAGDVGWETSSPSTHQSQDSMQTSGVLASNSQQSLASSDSHANAHVYVWPPTPAASEHGGSSEGKHANESRRDTLQAYSPGMATAQRARIETVQPKSPSQQSSFQLASASTPKTASHVPWSPSAVLASPKEMTATPENYSRPTMRRMASGQSAGHPAGRLPPQPPTTAPHHERYADPNMPLSSAMTDLGAARRQAIADRDGRESLVSDLDVETLRLDGSNDGDSRRGSVTSIGSFSSEKIREQRQRQSQASPYSSYSQASNDSSFSDKRSSNGTVRETAVPSRRGDAQHISWNGVNMRYDGLSDLTAEQANQIRRGPPKRSNTGPDSYQQEYQAQARSRLSAGPLQEQQRSVSSPQSQGQGGTSLTFSTPQPDRTDKKASIAVKGALNDTQAEKFLSLAITHHESGDLSRSAFYFERSAKVDGGCIVGMCMWGMALREGWGVRKDQKKGFDWISRAAARAGELMAGSQSGIKSEAELKAIRSEMKLSVYELGKCFCYGWGVKMDKPMALEYFELAARLGDADAQAEAGALLAAGKGCKKDLKKAAMYYRMAEAQGYDTVGLSWIHKDKYDP